MTRLGDGGDVAKAVNVDVCGDLLGGDNVCGLGITGGAISAIGGGGAVVLSVMR